VAVAVVLTVVVTVMVVVAAAVDAAVIMLSPCVSRSVSSKSNSYRQGDQYTYATRRWGGRRRKEEEKRSAADGREEILTGTVVPLAPSFRADLYWEQFPSSCGLYT
jgi:hypothetical protein